MGSGNLEPVPNSVVFVPLPRTWKLQTRRYLCFFGYPNYKNLMHYTSSVYVCICVYMCVCVYVCMCVCVALLCKCDHKIVNAYDFHAKMRKGWFGDGPAQPTIIIHGLVEEKERKRESAGGETIEGREKKVRK
ncbi:uncharacterized protein BO96DRAFT_157034 [Aspergillus niger CBS 101883]|uniref:uncharacterized protein n=1 Tax=Aspergillus lacticoffeatus (strain CBS 101883) TaxID=1450533 RepID=UPI000D7FAD2B|nr:uncharacterized protein BO96DRAFT_157034 [Aspergillus niger CBS 101883]PYH52620.1 hypothetical protein BO96DRAFT_157034 [Aspergillus niger CBS 101883]